MNITPLTFVSFSSPHDPEREIFRKEDLTPEESEFIQTVAESRSGPNLSGLIYPIRTNDTKHFFCDLCIPSTMYVDDKIKRLKLKKIIALVAAIALDILTLPIRLVTAIPRIYYNKRKPDSPLRSYLKENNVSPEAFSSDYILVTFPDQINISTYLVNLIDVPFYKESVCFQRTMLERSSEEDLRPHSCMEIRG